MSFTAADGSMLMVLYSGGVVGIFTLFALMHLHACRHCRTLGLSPGEEQVTRTTIRAHCIHAGIGISSVTLALLGQIPMSGLIYFLVGPAQFLNGWLSGRALARLQIPS